MPVGPIGLLLKQRLGVPYLVSLRGGDVPGLVPELTLVHQALKSFRRKVLRNATAVIANSRDLAQHSKDSDRYPVVVIPNGVDTEYFSPYSQLLSGFASHIATSTPNSDKILV